LHGQKKLTDGARGPSHELHTPFRIGISKASLKYDDAKKNHLHNLYQKDSKRKKVKEIGLDGMMQ
jgi:hypothetical protein